MFSGLNFYTNVVFYFGICKALHAFNIPQLNMDYTHIGNQVASYPCRSDLVLNLIRLPWVPLLHSGIHLAHIHIVS